MKLILEKEAKRTKTFLRILMISLAIKLSSSKLLNNLPNHLFQLRLPMKIDHYLKSELLMIFSTVIKVNMIETPIQLAISIRIGKRTTIKDRKTLERLTLHLFNLIIFLFQTLGRELLQ